MIIYTCVCVCVCVCVCEIFNRKNLQQIHTNKTTLSEKFDSLFPGLSILYVYRNEMAVWCNWQFWNNV